MPLTGHVQAVLMHLLGTVLRQGAERFDVEGVPQLTKQLLPGHLPGIDKPIVRFQTQTIRGEKDRQEVLLAQRGRRGTAMVTVGNISGRFLGEQSGECLLIGRLS